MPQSGAVQNNKMGAYRKNIIWKFNWASHLEDVKSVIWKISLLNNVNYFKLSFIKLGRTEVLRFWQMFSDLWRLPLFAHFNVSSVSSDLEHLAQNATKENSVFEIILDPKISIAIALNSSESVFSIDFAGLICSI